MKEAFETFERLSLIKKRYSRFFDVEKSSYATILKLYETGFCYPLKNSDEGRRIILIQTNKWNPEIFSVYDTIRLYCFVISTLLEEEETQIAGIITIFDYQELTLQQMMSPKDLMEFIDFVKNCSTTRQKGSYIVNLPSIGNVLMEFTKSILSQKLRERLFIVKHTNDLKNFINPSLLPEKYGGDQKEKEMLESFLNLYDKHRENVHKSLEFEPDWSKVSHEKIWSKNEDEPIGSFRKLEID